MEESVAPHSYQGDTMSAHCPLLFQHLTRTRATAAAMLLALVGCGGITETSDTPDACRGSVTATVGSGTTPEFSWSPSCGVGTLIVDGPTGQQNWWAGPFQPPVRYGVLSAGATESIPAQPLVVGKTYTVTLFERSLFDKPVGSASFTP
jgi:hypothetical protein